MSGLEINLLGVAGIVLDGKPIHLHRRHSLALLSYLVLTGRPHARGDIAARLAGDRDGEPARKLIRNAIGDLNRHGLGPYFVASRNALAFHPGLPVKVDVFRLDTVHAQGTAARSEDLLWASGFFGVELLSGLALDNGPDFEEWLLQEREHRRRQVIEMSLRLLLRYETNDDLENGIRLARRLLVTEPWNEDLQRRLIRLLARDDQITEAIEQFHRCTHILETTLGAAPEAETIGLYEQVRSGKRLLPNNLARSGSVNIDLVVGREDELAAIARHLARPDCRLVTILGISGSGRSTIAQSVAATLASPQIFPEEHRFADGVYLADFRDAATDIPPDLALVHGIGLALGLTSRENVISLENLVTSLAAKRMLIVLDNYEQLGCDGSVVQAVLRQAPHVSIVLTSREPLGLDGEWTERARGLGIPASPDDLSNAPAGKVLMREVDRQRAPVGPGDAAAFVQICKLAGGHPTALRILAAWLRVIPASEVVWQLTHAGPLMAEPVAMPGGARLSLQDIADNEWATLNEPVRQSMLRLSVLTGTFDFHAVAAVGVPLDHMQTLGDLMYILQDDGGYTLDPLMAVFGRKKLSDAPALEDDARRRHAEYFTAFISRYEGLLHQDQSAFETVNRSIPNLFAAWNRAVHDRNTQCLAGMLPGLTTWSELSGRHAEWADILARSAMDLNESLKVTADPEMHRTICSLLIAEADAVHWQGAYTRAIRAMVEAKRHADATGDPVLAARVSLRQARILHDQGNEKVVLRLLREAGELSVQASDADLEAFCMMVLGTTYIDYGQFQNALAVLDRAERTFQVQGEPGSIARVLLNRGRVWSTSAQYMRAQVALHQAIHTSRQFHDRPVEAWSTIYLALVLGNGLGNHGEAQHFIDRAHELAGEVGEQLYSMFVHWVDGRNALHIGDLDLARQRMYTALEMGRDQADTVSVARVMSVLAQCALATGDAGPAQGLIEQSIQVARDARRRPATASSLVVAGQVYEALELPQKAGAAYSRARAIAGKLGLPHIGADAHAGLASVAFSGGDITTALSHTETLLDYMNSWNLNGCEDPARVILTCYRVLAAAENPRSRDVLQVGYRLLQRRARTLPRDQRSRYLEATEARRELTTVIDAHGISHR